MALVAMCELAIREALFPLHRIVLTGGDSAWLAGHLSGPVDVRSNLVFEGIRRFCSRAMIFFDEPLVITLVLLVKFRALNRRNVVLEAGIAQMVEQRTCNAKVPSSILGAGTTAQTKRD